MAASSRALEGYAKEVSTRFDTTAVADGIAIVGAQVSGPTTSTIWEEAVLSELRQISALLQALREPMHVSANLKNQ